MPLQGYFDYNATTPMCQQAIDALATMLSEFGNPSSMHGLGRIPKQRLEVARSQVACLIGCGTTELIFTSGGTEANNWAIKGALASDIGTPPAHVIVSAIEHSSILETVAYLERVAGVEVTRLKPNGEGIVGAEVVKSALRPNTRLVSVMAVNNEVGAVQPVWEISTLLRDRSIHFHVDGVQAVGKIHLDVHGLGVDTLSFAAHKFHGPKGVGGLYIKKGVAIEPLLHGGGQENGLRGGTEAAALIVSMGAAADFAGSTLSEHVLLAARFRDKLKGLLSEHVPGVSFHGPTDPCRQAPNTLSVSIDGIRAEALAAILDQMHGIQISLGAACASNRHASLSHVLVAMGLGEPVIKATIRISFGRYTTEVELEHLVDAIAQGVQALQRIAKSVNHE